MDWNVGTLQDLSRRLTLLHNKDGVANARINGIKSQKIASKCLAIKGNRLNYEDLLILQLMRALATPTLLSLESWTSTWRFASAAPESR